MILNIWLENPRFHWNWIKIPAIRLQNKGDEYNRNMKQGDTALSGKTVGWASPVPGAALETTAVLQESDHGHPWGETLSPQPLRSLLLCHAWPVENEKQGRPALGCLCSQESQALCWLSLDPMCLWGLAQPHTPLCGLFNRVLSRWMAGYRPMLAPFVLVPPADVPNWSLLAPLHCISFSHDVTCPALLSPMIF